MNDKKETIKVRLQNDGTRAWNTKITDVSTGKELEHVLGFSWIVDLNDPVLRDGKASLTLWEPVIDVVVDAEIRKVCPCCGEVKK